ncbi:MAG: peptide deformylase [Deltaproteobacteria bacterium]|jgi:peptide deformylase|nr:peptide deformylase [Deltaproteobacteria bacterium]
MIRKVITYPDPILKKTAKAVDVVDTEIAKLIEDMVETMYADGGVGLAAPQVAVSLRVLVIDVDPDFEGVGIGLLKMVNPKIMSRDGDIEWEEGCLSVPDFRIKIKRSRKIVVQYLDENGAENSIALDGLPAVAVQHEMDHLDGKLIIDCASRIKQDLYLRKVRKKKKEEMSF